MSTEFWVFTLFTLFIGAIVVGFVAYDIYMHPADPEPAGTATILIGGTDGLRFSGDVGTVREPLGITATTPVTLEAPYRRADWVIASLRRKDPVGPTNRG